MKSAVSALYNAGADAMDNLFDVTIYLPAKDAGTAATGAPTETTPTTGTGTATEYPIQDQMRVRCQGFTPPHFSIQTYAVRYKTIRFTRPSSVITGERVFDLTFRLDANYRVYQELLKWRSLTMAPSTGYATNDFNSWLNAASISVIALAKPVATSDNFAPAAGISDEAKITAETGASAQDKTGAAEWTFKNVWLMDVSEPVYKQEGGAAMTITAKFAFAEYSDPFEKWYVPATATTP